MVVNYFLQLDPPLFPSDYQQLDFPPFIVQIQASPIPSSITSQYSTAYLVKGFFDYYKDFDWNKLIFPTIYSLPENTFIFPAVMTVLDPFTFLNCSKGVTSEGLQMIKLELNRASKILDEENSFEKLLENPQPFHQQNDSN